MRKEVGNVSNLGNSPAPAPSSKAVQSVFAFFTVVLVEAKESLDTTLLVIAQDAISSFFSLSLLSGTKGLKSFQGERNVQ